MVRKIIKIDESKCDGCGLCVAACHEGAIGLVNGKAKLLRDYYCDGLGDCLPVCPTKAITFEEREAAEYDEIAVKAKMKPSEPLPCGCPSTSAKTLHRGEDDATPEHAAKNETRLNQWPVQIKLVPVNAPYFANANLLIAADCAAYAYGNFHNDYMRNRITIIGCPKLDGCDYSEKLTEIIRQNNIKSVMVVRMEVLCCGGLEHAVTSVLRNSGKMIPWSVVTISTNGQILED